MSMKHIAHSHRLRIGRFSEVGQGYLLTTTTHNREPVFSDFIPARLAVRELRACDEAGLCQTLCFVLMPDHLHWLIQLRQGSLSFLMQRFKSCSARAVNCFYQMPGNKIWQAGYHDHAVRDDENVRAIARYIVDNPVRAGLVRRAGDYPHWDAIWL